MQSLFHSAWLHVASKRRCHVKRLVIASFILACLSLAACGSTVYVTTPGATASAPPSASATPLTTTDCGAIDRGLGGVTPKNFHDLEQCFFQADVACHPATLLYTEGGIDTSTDHQLSLASSGASCHPVDVATFHGCCSSVNQTTITTYQCVSAIEENGSLVIKSCGNEGDVALP